MTITYRKGEENDSDALSRRSDLMELTEESIENNPELKKKFEEYDAGVFERELDELQASHSEMTPTSRKRLDCIHCRRIYICKTSIS